jgi:LPS-assembly protein
VPKNPFWLAPLVGLWLAPGHARGADACLVPQPIQLDETWAEDDPSVHIDAGNMQLQREGGAEFTDGVEIRRGRQRIKAEAARYDKEGRRLSVDGPVEYQAPDLTIRSNDADLDTISQELSFFGASFELPQRPARGGADKLEIRADNSLGLEEVTYTTCPEGKNDWQINASTIDLDIDQGVGTGRNVKLDFKGVPILYLPYISFPISDKRKTGVLIPELRRSTSSGTDLALPYYINLAPNYDLTITPRLLTSRGLQLNSEFRYLLPSHHGNLRMEYLPNDSKLHRDRTLVSAQHVSFFRRAWRLSMDVSDVSDDEYFEDLGSSLSSASRTHLDRRVDFEFFAPNWTFLARAQAFQTIDDQITPDQKPYRRLPQLALQGVWGAGPVNLNLDTEVTSFDRDVGVDGWRFDATPEISVPFERRGMYFTPALAVSYTSYRLDNLSNSTFIDDNPSRTLPIASVDVGMRFERSLRNGRFTQLLQPRLLYVHIPFEQQADLPVFDTIMPDLNLVQLYRKSQFLGPDRIADTDRTSVGFTTRIIDNKTGRERLRATIGQIRYLSAQGVTLAGETPVPEGAAEYLAQVGVHLYGNWNFDVAYQWDDNTSTTTRAETRLQYRPGKGRLFNLAYRFRRGSLEQTDVSAILPIGDRWNLVGRHNFSLRDKTDLESFLGVEYDSCCWRLRVVGRRYVSRSDGQTDNSIAFQLELKGLTNVGDPADKLLERGILGYRDHRDQLP